MRKNLEVLLVCHPQKRQAQDFHQTYYLIMTSPTLRFLLSAIALIACLATAASAADSPPNVVLIITDDQGYGDISAHGNPILKTPALDELHGESLRLTDYHVTPTCAPTRGALLSGHYTNRAGP